MPYSDAVVERLTFLCQKIEVLIIFVAAIFAFAVIKFLWWLFAKVFFGGV